MKTLSSVLGLMLLNGVMFANDVSVIGTIQQPLHSRPSTLNNTSTILSQPRTVTLLKLHLSQAARNDLNQRLQTASELSESSYESFSDTKDISRIRLGMGNIPVLDQGPFGTCVTFAVTAAIDVLLEKGDYVSQLCTLQLGNYLERNGYVASGWNGSDAGSVFNLISSYGIVGKKRQKATGCGELTAYPKEGSIPKHAMKPEQYHKLSTPLSSILMTPLVQEHEFILNETSPGSVLKKVKEALRAHDRLLLGVLLLNIHSGNAGAVGTYNANNDTWVISSDIINTGDETSLESAGHEMIIIGYDDNAEAVDDQGHHHRGLLVLRNSWGSNAGDQGNFYMSYQYFKAAVLDVQRIRKMS